PENTVQFRQLFRTIHMLATAYTTEVHCLALEIELAKSSPMKQAIPRCDVDAKPWRLPQPGNITRLQRRHQHPNARNRPGLGIHVHAIHGIQSALYQLMLPCPWRCTQPPVENALESTEQKMARTTSRVKHPQPF